jgi:fructosamine-3-kinase
MRWAGGDLPEVVGDVFGARPIASARLHGGDANDAYKIRLPGTTVFVKTQLRPAPAVFTREAEGLAWLAETATVRVPQVLAVRDDPELVHRFLVLEWIEAAPPAPDHDERLGRSLADLHRFPCARFGGEADNYVGALPQANQPAPTWAEFYGDRRLAPLVREAVDGGRLPLDAARWAESVRSRLPELTGPPEPPARLHGDLWAGNAMRDGHGRPVLVDPAVYGGHREVDLAMMRLFGGFGAAVFAAYEEAHPLAPGHEDRVGLYQLYPLLVHTLLFGGSYGRAAAEQLRRYA